MGGAGAATVVIAHPDRGGRELLARIVEAAGHDAVRIDATAPPELVDTTVEASALVLVVDVTAIGFADLDSVVGAFATRRYPARVVALVDGPASAASAASIGVAAVLERPFHRDSLVAALADLLAVEPDQPTEATRDDRTAGDNAAEDAADVDAVDDVEREPPAQAGEPGADGRGDRTDAVRTADSPDPNFGMEFDHDRAEDPEGDDEPGPERDHRTEASEDQTEETAEPEGSEPEPERPRPVDHSFTDILRMGRQL